MKISHFSEIFLDGFGLTTAVVTTSLSAIGELLNGSTGCFKGLCVDANN